MLGAIGQGFAQQTEKTAMLLANHGESIVAMQNSSIHYRSMIGHTNASISSFILWIVVAKHGGSTAHEETETHFADDSVQVALELTCKLSKT